MKVSKQEMILSHPRPGSSATLDAILDICALEDLDSLLVRLEAERAMAFGLPSPERERRLQEIEIMSLEITMQIRNEHRRRGGRGA